MSYTCSSPQFSRAWHEITENRKLFP